jgi:hypothetical protein
MTWRKGSATNSDSWFAMTVERNRKMPRPSDPEPFTPRGKVRHLAVLLGDQLNRDASAWDGFDDRLDLTWMAWLKNP